MDNYLNQTIKTHEKLTLLCLIAVFMLIACYLYFGDIVFIVVASFNLLQIVCARYTQNKMIQTKKREYLEKWIREGL